MFQLILNYNCWLIYINSFLIQEKKCYKKINIKENLIITHGYLNFIYLKLYLKTFKYYI